MGEASVAKHQLAATLDQGVREISENQTITFTLYRKLDLPTDGSVFWVRADQVTPSALYNSARLNRVRYDQPPVTTAATTFVARGSLHYVTQASQNEADADTFNRVTFTALEPIQDLNQIAPNTLWVGEWQGLRFAFSARASFYEQAKLWHYEGTALLASMDTQLIDDLSAFSSAQVVSNSLPLWLGLRYPYIPILGLDGLPYPVIPSFLIDNNLVPPFVAIHIRPDTTAALALATTLGPTMDHDQLTEEWVRVTTVGLRNREALDFCDYVQAYFDASGTMGIMNSPVPRDEKMAQVEFGVLAQKKTIDFRVNYLQSVARDIVRKIVIEAAYSLRALPAPGPTPGVGIWDESRWDSGARWG